ncbi:MAG: SLC13/DASS family transporter [Gammaproteobacteria bacterium]|nr:MAG: SLC13/DASS family transporter [Gammaproteobacteria bacterium]
MSTAALRQRIGLVLGPLLFVLLQLLPVSGNMPPHAMDVASVAVLMAVFWISEAIPLAATALIPIALFPLLGVMPTDKVTLAYGNHLIFLFMGGFLIAVAIEKWQLHRRIALHTILLVGVTPERIVLGFMLATAFLSAWISNTATAMMMVTIGLAVIRQTLPDGSPEDNRGSPFATTLMLGIAYAASIGGVATLIGTPPNAILAGVIESNYGYKIGFAEWMLFGAPLSFTMLMLTWFYLTRIGFHCEFRELPGGKQAIRQQLNLLGPMSSAEKKVLGVFLLVAIGWIVRGLVDIPVFKQLNDSSIAMMGALLLFIIPANFSKGEFLLDWQTARNIPWDIIILFGGGFALASGFVSSGLTEWLANQLTGLQGMPLVIMVAVIVALVIMLTEVTSNTATASMLLPIVGAFALAVAVHPLYLMVGVALAASFAFMLPVATPPNAIIFSSRQVTVPQMAKAGIWLNLLGVVLITVFVLILLPLVFDISQPIGK